MPGETGVRVRVLGREEVGVVGLVPDRPVVETVVAVAAADGGHEAAKRVALGRVTVSRARVAHRGTGPETVSSDAHAARARLADQAVVAAEAGVGGRVGLVEARHAPASRSRARRRASRGRRAASARRSPGSRRASACAAPASSESSSRGASNIVNCDSRAAAEAGRERTVSRARQHRIARTRNLLGNVEGKGTATVEARRCDERTVKARNATRRPEMRPEPLARHQADRRRQGRCSQTPVAGWKMKACLGRLSPAGCVVPPRSPGVGSGRCPRRSRGGDRVHEVDAPPVADGAELACAEAGRSSRRPSVLAAERS